VAVESFPPDAASISGLHQADLTSSAAIGKIS
jgi:hypothetical protein